MTTTRAKFEQLISISLNIGLFTLICLCVYYLNIKIIIIRLCVLTHTIIIILHMYFVTEHNIYNKIPTKRNTNGVVLLINYFIVVDYNTVYTIMYLFLKNRKLKLDWITILYNIPMIAYRIIQVILLGMPYKVIVLCKILIKPVLDLKKNPYDIFICNLNGLIHDSSQPQNWCIYLNYPNIYINGNRYVEKYLSKYNRDIFLIKDKNTKGMYHRAFQIHNEHIVFTTQKTTYGLLNGYTGHDTSGTKVPIYANINKYNSFWARPCNDQYGHINTHNMVINMFTDLKSKGEVYIFHHQGNGKKTIETITYIDYMCNTKSLYIKLIHDIINM